MIVKRKLKIVTVNCVDSFHFITVVIIIIVTFFYMIDKKIKKNNVMKFTTPNQVIVS